MSTPTARVLTGVAAAWVIAILAAGCGEAGEEGTPALPGDAPPGEGGTLVWAVADRVETTDPLIADTRAESIAARQVNEPLTARVRAPFEPERRAKGLARSARSSGDNTIWTFELRSGVRFQDGTSFNSAAVRANALRWQTTAPGRKLLPDLAAVAATKQDEVRFILDEADPRFAQRLASPRLGLVSPAALQPGSGEGAVVTRSTGTGTGPFEFRERGPGGALLARNTEWWGAVAGGFGPALDQIELRTEPSSSVRLALLDAGEAQVADSLEGAQARIAERDPLLAIVPGRNGTWLGLERSVRMIDSARQIPLLSAAWIAELSDPR